MRSMRATARSILNGDESVPSFEARTGKVASMGMRGSLRVATARLTAVCAALIGLVALAVAPSVAFAEAGRCMVRSAPMRVPLVELYSSEGCNSCPPADRWLAGLAAARQRQGGGAADASSIAVVPLALHVDYWDNLGWADRFAQHRFSERQATLGARSGTRFVYTPEVFVDGRELRDWSSPRQFAARIAAIAAEPAPASIGLALAHDPNGQWRLDARYDAKAQGQRRLEGYAAVYENGLESAVGAGENRGVVLHHERVVRQWIGPAPLVGGTGATTAAIERIRAGARFGVVAFVADAATGEVLQAVDLPACAG
jgi:hypothetical protein